jgi:aryl-alcohol dehydrogenase-like predicted oxidoreductase
LRKDVVFRILDQAWELGIRRFDTAEAYGLAAPWLSEWLRTRRRTGTAAVITKLGIDQIADAGAVAMAVNLFAGVQSTTILSHDFTSAERWETLRDEALAEGARCGQSVYTAAEVQAAARLGAQRVQAPGNVFDFRTIRVGQAAGVPMDVRSVYLQGLLLETPEMADKRIPGSAPLVRAVHRAAAEIESTTASALLASALTQLGPLDRIVIGIDDASQLADISAAGEVPQASACSFGELLDGASTTEASALKLVLDPRYWN